MRKAAASAAADPPKWWGKGPVGLGDRLALIMAVASEGGSTCWWDLSPNSIDSFINMDQDLLIGVKILGKSSSLFKLE